MFAAVRRGVCYDVQVRCLCVLWSRFELIVVYSRHPDDLYKNGIQRSSFIPCIELIKSRFDVTDLDSGTGMLKRLDHPALH